MTKQQQRGEFGLIAELLAPLAENDAAVALTDDAARVAVADGQELVISTDILVAGVHFPDNASPELVANRLLACNLSDLAAKGAEPYGCLLNLGLAGDWQDAWQERFVAAFGDGLKAYNMQLWGGDTVATGQGFVGLTVHGLVPTGSMLTRRGAQNGDNIYVTGTIGDGFLGLQHILAGTEGDSLSAYAAPQPPLVFGLSLRGLAHAAIDISDGLMADLDHICRNSGGQMMIEASAIPLSPEGQAHGNSEDLLSGGDDLQIAFTAPPEKHGEIEARAREAAVMVSKIGRFLSPAHDGPKSACRAILMDETGAEIPLQRRGFRHF